MSHFNKTDRALAVSLRTMLVGFALLAGLFTSGTASAQVDFEFGDPLALPGLDPVGQAEPYALSATYTNNGGNGTLSVTATLGGQWHIYSITQGKGGPLPTKINVTAPKGVEVAGAFKPDRPPQKSFKDEFPGVEIEDYSKSVTWTAPIRVPAGFGGELEVSVTGLVCQAQQCQPVRETIMAVAVDSGSPSPVVNSPSPAMDALLSVKQQPSTKTGDPFAGATPFQDKDYPVKWHAGVTSILAPGDTGYLVFQAIPESPMHVYKEAIDDSKSATNFVVIKKQGVKIGAPVADGNLQKSETLGTSYYEGKVTWKLPIRVPEDAIDQQYTIEGMIVYQACTNSSCLRPMAMYFSTTVQAGSTTQTQFKAVHMEHGFRADAMDNAAKIKWVDKLASTTGVGNPNVDTAPDSAVSQIPGAAAPTDDAKNEGAVEDNPFVEDDDSEAAPVSEGSDPAKSGFAWLLFLAVGGGVILNLMPCVLPVIGLKVMSFVKQAGEARSRVILLNLAYVAGILAAFAVFAVLVGGVGLVWGDHMTLMPVRFALTILVFAMALSSLGVWELPTPKFASSQASQELQDQQGLVGAFFTGIFATILATPCTGPFMGTALAATVDLPVVQSVTLVMAVGVGMALPYILLAAFPSLMNYVPKPGKWMETLKEFMAFLFLGTVAFFFISFNETEQVWVFISLIGVWFGLWVVGKTPPYMSFGKQLRAWTIGVTSAVVISGMTFFVLHREPVKWEAYSEARLQELQAQGTTVMLDFTADWCASCKVNSLIAVDTNATGAKLRELGGVAMLADYTDFDPEITNKLDELRKKGIPLLAIYPGGSPNQPIVLPETLTQGQVLDALEQAGPSLSKASRSSAKSLTSALPATPAMQR